MIMHRGGRAQGGEGTGMEGLNVVILEACKKFINFKP